MKSGFWSLLATAATLVAVTGQVQAGQQINLVMDRSIMITVAGEPATVVIGNPSIADISLNGKQVFLHGHSAGDTNLLILDKDGNQLADFDLSVSHINTNMVSVFKGGSSPNRYSYTCAPYCEALMIPGDDIIWTEAMITLNAKKNALATGKPTAEAAAPAAPQ